ncbi:MAG: hypothetical protein K2H21_09635 [Muribaculaceae bacterium]|nr:hypothetical protein [Muribaculaceae bacterium]
MTKTIEEAAREFMETAPIAAVSPYYEEDMIEMFRGGTAHALSLPLSQRLTDEERERVRKMYKDELEMAQLFHARAKASNDVSCKHHYYVLREPYIARMKLLLRIFGKEFFEENETENNTDKS